MGKTVSICTSDERLQWGDITNPHCPVITVNGIPMNVDREYPGMPHLLMLKAKQGKRVLLSPVDSQQTVEKLRAGRRHITLTLSDDDHAWASSWTPIVDHLG